ncbi:hypothetical protein [Silvibacterium dinghuense]|uniref:DUF2846 domain-containing protein n=1 Tax=Silvibacterium dinghuense TaxID=1560006 RepID=A0A4Q1SK42_9BACT|nr:hypothetical protein [Silvibacterium dinghuense]RXS98036.1 hypothetical protein ESZ00_09415 [Silvibacterium dinghuense]
MRLLLFLLLLSAPLYAEDASVYLQRACGPSHVSYDAHQVKNIPAPSPLDPQMARVYFIQDVGSSDPLGVGRKLITRVGMDGHWSGAVVNESWFSVDVAGGEHHACISSQDHLLSPVTELIHFNAEPGKTYYFRIRNFMWQTRRYELQPADSDQANLMIGKFAYSASTAKP